MCRVGLPWHAHRAQGGRELGSKAKTLSKIEIRKECRKYAAKFLDAKRKSLSTRILGDFEQTLFDHGPFL